LVGIAFVYKRGKELDEDPEFLERMKDPAFARNLESEKKESVAIKPGAITSLAIFGLAV
jgi:anaerobic C4-dicarboxylate transporter DcuA